MKKVKEKRGRTISKNTIQTLRLNNNEVRVLKVVTFVPQKLIEIEKEALLPHTTVYEVLFRLRSRGLVLSIGEGRARRWMLLSSSKITEVGKATHKDIEIVQGKELVISLISKLFIEHKGDRLLSFHGVKIMEGWIAILNREDIEKRNLMIIENNIIVERYVPEDGYKRVFRSFPESWHKTMLGRTHITYFLPDDLFDTKTELLMFSDMVLIYETDISRVTIFRNKETVKLYSHIFEMMRRVGRKINSEAEFRKYLER